MISSISQKFDAILGFFQCVFQNVVEGEDFPFYSWYISWYLNSLLVLPVVKVQNSYFTLSYLSYI